MTIDLDNIRERALPTRDGFYHVVGAYRVMREEDFDALVAEIERLRHTVADQQMLLDEHRLDNMHAHQQGGEDERAAVVAYLRTRPGYGPVADVIEEGEHRRKEDE